MSFFPPQVYAERIARAQQLCKDKGISGLIIGTGAQLAYLTGSWASTHERLTCLVIPASGTPRFILPAVDRAELPQTPIPELDVEVVGWVDGKNPHELAVEPFRNELRGTIGVGQHLTADHLLKLQGLLPNMSFVLASQVLTELFIRKDEAEIDQLRQAGAAIDRVHARVPELLAEGRTEREVAAEIEKLILEEHSAVDFIIVGSQENGANPHHDFSDRMLETGDMVVVDIGGTYGHGYHSDCTRTYIVGGPEALTNTKALSLYEVLFAAQKAAVDAVRPGMTAKALDAIARTPIAEAGFGEQFIHRTGHGIGLSTHEEPFIIEGNDLVLEEGMCFSIEPGIYLEGEVGARIEDIVVVTADGCERLNKQPRILR